MMKDGLSASAKRVQKALDEFNLPLEVIELPGSTRTAADAAQSIGCGIGQIVKSLVFKGKRSEKPVLVVASGINRVSETKVEGLLDEPLGKADADFVREHTGFVIGGVPPIGHPEKLLTIIDEDLFLYSEIWAAAGTPNAVFRLTPEDLLRMTVGKVHDIRQ